MKIKEMFLFFVGMCLFGISVWAYISNPTIDYAVYIEFPLAVRSLIFASCLVGLSLMFYGGLFKKKEESK